MARDPFTTLAEAFEKARSEGFKIVEQISTRRGTRLNVVRRNKPQTWKVNDRRGD